jgi:uncharacterized protein (DUF1015 family)
LARIYNYQPYRYTAAAGPLADLVTQPYDKISPEMQSGYMAKSPYNLVRFILGERKAGDNESNNVYTRAAAYLDGWIANGILAQDAEPGIYPYFQEFTIADTGERLVRKGFIALGGVEEYSANVIYRHEHTHTGPKQDRLELLRHSHAQAELLFLLYADEAGEIDALLDRATAGPPLGEVTDEYGAIHRIWKIAGDSRIPELMADKKLLIADGHHRYETALAFHKENPGLPGADRVPMAFVNMHSPGLRILATHRVINGLPHTEFAEHFLRAAANDFIVREIEFIEALQSAWHTNTTGCTILGAAIGDKLYALEERDARNELDVRVLHDELIAKALGISADDVRDGKFVTFVRGIEPAIAQVREGRAQIAFLVKPVSVAQVADTSFGGGVMPQKSTDFYPKLLSGLTIYKMG